ncbi:MAG TPA: sigma-70 family RNA polymerase sigma factor [Pyrinomonadaceae bacterium]|nr:sigma-70 family RNA polymerase sigma factor [Pyrinomonadaceae bacterium]
MDPANKVTELIVDWRNGNEEAFDSLFAVVYEELRRLASGYMRGERSDHTLQTTALVHEAYMKLVRQSDSPVQNRVHFFAVAAKVMRQILIDHARTRHYEKRGGKAVRISLDDAAVLSDERAEALVALDEALTELSAQDERQSQIVEMRYFGGLTIAETADFLKVSPDTVTRDWNMSKAWLYRRLNPQEPANDN